MVLQVCSSNSHFKLYLDKGNIERCQSIEFETENSHANYKDGFTKAAALLHQTNGKPHQFTNNRQTNPFDPALWTR